ncbi:Ig-like domain-containing protein [Thermophagus xiamenensis]|uniref:Ig-like domain-containing protein n=1 Tax=Thermophagus xiamenensis TaxID=385682 RepID=A0A1I2DCZ8_9BACT|nr:Ig-like domain-containing protein [Thermophagus xiamenensis]SFE78406.1 Ig-like domain-containing protein [Thermophagus xiamenensis]
MNKLLQIIGGIIFACLVSSSQLNGQTYSPEIGAVNVSTSPVLTITFDPGTEIEFSSGKFIYLETQEDVIFYLSTGSDRFGPDEALSISDNVLTIDLSGYNLNEETEYYVTTTENAIQVNGSYWNDLYFGNPNQPYWTFTTTGGFPSWYEGYPNISNQSPTSVTLNGQTNKDGTYYYVITTDFTAPSETQIAGGYNLYGSPAELSGSGSMTADTPFSETINVSALSYGNIYFLHVVAQNSSGFSEVKTYAIDLIPPILNEVEPDDGAENISIYSTIILSYSEKILGSNGDSLAQSNITDYIRLLNGEGEVPYTLSVSDDGKTLTLTPESPLEDNTTYSITFLQKFEDVSGNKQTELSSTKTFTTEDLIIWTGEQGSDWTNPDNWDDTVYPDGESVLIPTGLSIYPDLNSDLSVKNLYIEPGASLTQSDGTLTITGVFMLQSSSEVNASFIPQGDSLIVNPENVMFYQKVASPTRNYNFGVPVIGTNKSNIGITNLLYEYQNSADSYILKGADETLIPGTGYICRSDQDMIFSGTPVTWDFTKTLLRSNAGLGWNLVANPYSATLDFTQLEFDTSAVAPSFWIWDNVNEKYNTYNATSGVGIGIPNNTPDIPSHQAFWMKVQIGYSSASVGFSTGALKANTTSYLKSTSTKYPILKLESIIDGKTDETAVVFAENASNDYGDTYDTDKMFTYSPQYCQIYTLLSAKSLAINGLIPSTTDIIIPLGYKIDKTGNVEIKIKENTLPSNSKVLLEDKTTGEIINLSENGSYHFMAENTGTYNDRFVLYVSGSKYIPTDIEENTNNSNENKTSIYSTDSEIIAYIGTLKNPGYKLIDIKGKIIATGELKPQSENRIKVSNKGMVILIVESEKEKLEYKTVF